MTLNIHGCCVISALSLCLGILVTPIMFLIFRNVDSPLGRFLKGGANAGRNIYSFGFGKVRCYG